MACGVDTEAVNAHLDEFAVALHEIFGNGGILSVEVDAVTGNLSPPAAGIVPVPGVGEVVPVVVVVVVLTIGVLQVFEAGGILNFIGVKIPVRCAAELLLIGDERCGNACLVADVVRTVEKVAEVVFAEIRGVVEHDVKHDFHAFGMCGVDEALESHVLACAPFLAALIAEVYFREVHGVVAVEVGAGSVLHYRGDPDGGEAESLDVVELVDEALEVAAPVGVTVGNLDVLVIPAAYVVGGVTVIETGGHGEVDGFIAEIGAVADKCSG